MLTTPDDPAEGTLSGFRKILESAGLESSDLASIVHATTLITNALIERKGARTGLITTQGFSDVIEIGREKRFDLYDLHQEMPDATGSRRSCAPRCPSASTWMARLWFPWM